MANQCSMELGCGSQTAVVTKLPAPGTLLRPTSSSSPRTSLSRLRAEQLRKRMALPSLSRVVQIQLLDLSAVVWAMKRAIWEVRDEFPPVSRSSLTCTATPVKESIPREYTLTALRRPPPQSI